MFIFEIFVVLFVISRRRKQVFDISCKVLIAGIGGGLVSALAYGLVIFAKTLSPLGMVSTLRETSVLFAALIGVAFLGERPWHSRVLAAFVVVFGVILLATA